MGRTALYRDPVPWRPARAEVELDPDSLRLQLPDGRVRWLELDGCTAATVDGVYAAHERRFVRMLVLEHAEVDIIITPPERGAVAPNILRLPEAPAHAAIVEDQVWETLADWVMGGGRLAACAIADLARLAVISSPQFAVLIGEVAAQRALELWWATRGPLRGGPELEIALQPFTDAARFSPRAAEALVSALAHAAGATRRRHRLR
jgi:hypothetical protein